MMAFLYVQLLKPSRNCLAYDKYKEVVFSTDPIKALNEENKVKQT